MFKQGVAVLAVILLAACIAEGVYIHHLLKSQGPDPWAHMNSWVSGINQELKSGQPVPLQEFDKLFNDEFFSRQFDPFREIDNFSEKIATRVASDQQALLNDSWAQWFKNRMDVGDLHPQISSTPRQVILAMTIPNIRGDSLKVDVTKDRIRLSYQVEKSHEEKDQQGHVTQSFTSMENIEKIMPVPDGANAGTWRVIRRPEAVEIVFDKATTAAKRWAPLPATKAYQAALSSNAAGTLR